MNRRILFAWAIAAAATLIGGGGEAAEFPRKAIQLMVMYPAGGSTDVGARIVASIAEKEFGQSVVVVNKPGAGGQVGWTEFTRQRPDGYTLSLINLPGLNTIILDPERKAVFKADSFVPIINQVLDPGAIWVKADAPYKTLADLVEAARKAPETITACTTGILSDDHLAIMMLEEAANIRFRIVHFDGGAPQMTAILGRHVESAFDNVGGIAKRVQSGEIRALAVLDTERSKFLPDVPTTPELGFPSVISSSTRGIAGPKGLPADIVKQLEAGFKKAMENPEHVKKLEDSGLGLKIMVGAEYKKYYDDIHARAAKYTEWARTHQR